LEFWKYWNFGILNFWKLEIISKFKICNIFIPGLWSLFMSRTAHRPTHGQHSPWLGRPMSRPGHGQMSPRQAQPFTRPGRV
jgi:hypothetical protein